jgi:Transcription factor WhiB
MGTVMDVRTTRPRTLVWDEHGYLVGPSQPEEDVVLVDADGRAPVWQDASECSRRRLDPRAMDPKSDRYNAAATRAACAACPVVAQCRDAAERDPKFEGTAGGEIFDTKRRGKRELRVAIDAQGDWRIIDQKTSRNTTAKEVAA